MPNAFLTGRLSGTTTARAFTPRIAGVVLLMRLSLESFCLAFLRELFDRIPSREALRGPIGCYGFDQPVPGMFGRKGDALGLAGLDRQRLEPERLPAVVEPVEQAKVVA